MGKDYWMNHSELCEAPPWKVYMIKNRALQDTSDKISSLKSDQVTKFLFVQFCPSLMDNFDASYVEQVAKEFRIML